jgi:hypothetical protein
MEIHIIVVLLTPHSCDFVSSRAADFHAVFDICLCFQCTHTYGMGMTAAADSIAEKERELLTLREEVCLRTLTCMPPRAKLSVWIEFTKPPTTGCIGCVHVVACLRVKNCCMKETTSSRVSKLKLGGKPQGHSSTSGSTGMRVIVVGFRFWPLASLSYRCNVYR